jgi:hypothetical protein
MQVKMSEKSLQRKALMIREQHSDEPYFLTDTKTFTVHGIPFIGGTCLSPKSEVDLSHARRVYIPIHRIEALTEFKSFEDYQAAVDLYYGGRAGR